VAKDTLDKVADPGGDMAYDLGQDEMVCPRCFITQKKSGTCTCCGLVISKRRASERRQSQQQQQQQVEACTVDADGPWGQRGGRRPDAPAEKPLRQYTVGELFRGLFDLSFDRLITPGMIKAIYGFLLIFGGAVALILVNFFLFASKNYAAAAATVAGYLLAIIVVRIQAEFLIIFFRIEKQTRKTDGSARG
jgi:hypothetical protein